jgi:Transferase family
VYFTEEHHDVPMREHPLAAKLPRPTDKVATFPGPKEFCSLGLGPETPRNIDDFVFSAKPQFCLHVQTFTDGTLVSVTHSHVSTDLMGWASILEAWSLVLAGKPEAVAPMVGYHEDAFDTLWNPAPKQPHVLANKVLDGWRMKYWGIRSLYESWRCPDVQSRTMCIPSHTMKNIMQEARSHNLVKVDATASGPNEPFISEGDVLTAIACRTLAQYHGPESSRELATIMAVDPRSRARSVFRQGAAYVQNSPTNIFFFCRAKEALELPLGKLALSVRETIATQAAEEQLKAAASLSVESMRATKMPVIFGDKNMACQFMSNWTKGSLAEKMDFSPAVVRDAASRTGKSKRGHPVYYQASDPSHNAVSVISSVFVVMEKDYDDNTWFSISLPGKMWSDLMEYLEQFG